MVIKDFKIRCSAIGHIMAGNIGLTEIQSNKLAELKAKLKRTDKQDAEMNALIEREANKELPEGAKTYCKDWLKGQIYNRKREISTKYTDKGNIVEDDSIDFVAKMLGYDMLIKNQEYFENDFMLGEPDVLPFNLVIDNKNSWDCFTFPLFDDEIENKAYYLQLQGYMHLTKRKKAKLIYVLSDTPQHLIERECRYWCFKNGYEFDIEIYKEFLAKMTYPEIDDYFKIKVFDIEYDEKVIKEIEDRVKLCRKYIEQLKLKLKLN